LIAWGGSASLFQVGGGSAARQSSNASHERCTLGGRNDTARVHQIKEMRALQTLVVRRNYRKPAALLGWRAYIPFQHLPSVEELLSFLFMKLELRS
jgi:hypothetical protein